MAYSFWESLVRILLFLPLVLVLAYLMIKFGLSRSLIRQQGRHLKVIDQVALSPKATINVVKVADKYYLIGATENQIVYLKEIDTYPEEDKRETSHRFVEVLKKFKGGEGDE